MDLMAIFKSNSPAVINDNGDKTELVKKLIEQKENVFVTGGAGTGKSYILKELKKDYGETLHITSTTGISALNVNGQTVHSWSGMGFVNEPRRDFDYKVERAFYKIKQNNEELYRKIFNAKMLAIDEISMLDNVTFDFISAICKRIRNNNKPFGGIQIILFGDFYQLPPVSKEIGYDFCFYSKTWDELKLKSVNLTKVYRQDDPKYVKALNNLREGIIDKGDTEMFNKRVEESKFEEKEDITHIYGTNKEASSRNLERFNKLNTPVFTYLSQDVFIKYTEDKNNEPNEIKTEEIEITYNYYGYLNKGNFEKEQIDLIKDFNENCRAPQTLRLRVGARVMLTRNNKDLNLANGSCGEVTDLTDDIIRVKFDGQNSPVSVPKATFEYYYNDRVVITRYQFPLVLAYAMTIHKSQGLTIDKIVVNFDRIFDHGQGYVALSRTKTLKGLILDSYNPDLISASEDVTHFYKVLDEKGCFTEEDYPDSKLERLDFESQLEVAISNESIMKKKLELIKKNIGKDIEINYYEKKQGWKIIPRKIRPKEVALGEDLDKTRPIGYNRKSDKYYIVSHCYLRGEEREFKPEMLEIADTGIPDLDFSYVKEDGEEVNCNVAEEIEQNDICVKKVNNEIPLLEVKPDPKEELKETYIEFDNDTTGITYEDLFAPYIKGATQITITDAFIRNYYQILNLKEFITMLEDNDAGNNIEKINLDTSKDDVEHTRQDKFLKEIQNSCEKKGIEFSYSYNATHARSVETDTGWKIVLDRGLDIFKKCNRERNLHEATKSQKNRTCRDFYVFYKKKV